MTDINTNIRRIYRFVYNCFIIFQEFKKNCAIDYDNLSVKMDTKNNKKKGNTYCCVPQCNNYNKEGLSFHIFPTDDKLRKRWESVLRLRRPSSNYMRVCSEHFTELDYFPGIAKSRRKLKRDVIPSKKLPVRQHDKQLTVGKQLCIDQRTERAQRRHNSSVSVNNDIQKNEFEVKNPIQEEESLSENAVKTDAMEKDTTNYMMYKMGFSQKILLADEAVPTKFHCHKDRKRRLSSRKIFVKRQRTELVPESLQSHSAIETHAEILLKDVDMTQKVIDPEGISEKTVSRITKEGQIRDAITSSGVSQCSKDFVVETPQTRMNVPEDNIECYTIIANVYRYLKQQYEWLQRQLGSLYDVSALSDILARTAAAAGVSQRDVTRALHATRLHAAIRADHSYTKGIARPSTTSKSKNAGFSVSRHRKSGTPSHTLKKKQEDHENQAKNRTTKRSISSKPSNEDQLLSKKEQSNGSISGRKRQSNDNEEEHDGESMGPPVRRLTRISEEQLPFPSPIQLRVHGVMGTEYNDDDADDDCEPTPEEDPLQSGSWSHHHCEQATTTEETEILFKTEPADDECLQDLKPDPLELESSAAALQEPPDSPDTTQFEVKFECVDEDMNVCEDYLSSTRCTSTPNQNHRNEEIQHFQCGSVQDPHQRGTRLSLYNC